MLVLLQQARSLMTRSITCVEGGWIESCGTVYARHCDSVLAKGVELGIVVGTPPCIDPKRYGSSSVIITRVPQLRSVWRKGGRGM